ncbi:MAG: biotin/lipoyl-binding protein [bacterium]|nr:biotin/lipoyl-binding protein [bacterium]
MKWIVRGTTTEREVEVERIAGGFDVVVDGKRRKVDLVCLNGRLASLRYTDDNRSHHVSYERKGSGSWRVAVGEREFDFAVLSPIEASSSDAVDLGTGASCLEAPIPGKVVSVNVAEGDEVEAGHSMVVLEAMKMENELIAERAGRVARVLVAAGETVDTGTVLVELE